MAFSYGANCFKTARRLLHLPISSARYAVYVYNGIVQLLCSIRECPKLEMQHHFGAMRHRLYYRLFQCIGRRLHSPCPRSPWPPPDMNSRIQKGVSFLTPLAKPYANESILL